MRRALLGFLLCAAAVQAGPAAGDWAGGCRAKAIQAELEFAGLEERDDHRLKPIAPVFVDSLGARADVQLCLKVDTDGSVTLLDAKPGEEHEAVRPALPRAVAAMRFRPFLREGRPVVAVLWDRTLLLERPVTHPVPFPEPRDPASVSMRLAREGCERDCPDYRVEISGDGRVIFDSNSSIAVPGYHTWKITAEAARALFERFRRADFFSLPDRYEGTPSPAPAWNLTLSVDGKVKSVRDRAGALAGMPKPVTELEREVDRVAGTARWIEATPETMDALAAENWDFAKNPKTVTGLAGHGTAGMVSEALAKGAVVRRTSEGCRALVAAADAGNIESVRVLLDAGAPVDASGGSPFDDCNALVRVQDPMSPEIFALLLDAHPSQSALDEALCDYAGQELLAQAKLLVAHGANPNARTVLWFAPLYAGNSSEAAVRFLLGAGAKADVRDKYGDTVLTGSTDTGAVRLLIAAGVDVRARNRAGITALHRAVDGRVAKALIEAGADVDARDEYGETPLMTAGVEATRTLLRAGADPWMRDESGDTAADRARRDGQHAKAVILRRWMAAHPRR